MLWLRPLAATCLVLLVLNIGLGLWREGNRVRIARLELELAAGRQAAGEMVRALSQVPCPALRRAGPPAPHTAARPEAGNREKPHAPERCAGALESRCGRSV